MTGLRLLNKRRKRRYYAIIMSAFRRDQRGFIPMIICLILLIVAVLYISYQHVSQAQH